MAASCEAVSFLSMSSFLHRKHFTIAILATVEKLTTESIFKEQSSPADIYSSHRPSCADEDVRRETNMYDGTNVFAPVGPRCGLAEVSSLQ